MSLQDVNLQHIFNYFIDHERIREVFAFTLEVLIFGGCPLAWG